MWIHIAADLSQVTLGKNKTGVEIVEYSFVYQPLGVLVTLHMHQKRDYDIWDIRIYDVPGGVWYEASIVYVDCAVSQKTTQYTLWNHREGSPVSSPTRP